MSKTTEVKCEKCDGNLFANAVKIRRLSPLMSSTGEEMFAPIPAYHCLKCKEEFVIYETGEE
ncbi:hypothetical protein H8D85_02490 [bacterium]|nr:hypothetical protein [bacterium]